MMTEREKAAALGCLVMKHRGGANYGLTSKKSGLNVEVAAVPDSAAPLSMDVQLVKSALLYADTVTLHSPAASGILNVLGLKQLGPEERSQMLLEMIEIFEPDTAEGLKPILQKYWAIKRRGAFSKKERSIIAKVDQDLPGMWDTIVSQAAETTQSSHIDELVPIIDAGLLSVEPYDDLDAAVIDFLDRVIATANDPLAIPLFDEGTSELLREVMADGRTEIREQKDLNKTGALAANLFDRLPSFESATLDEIIDIRKDLDKYLVRFRGAMLKFAGDVRCQTWDAEFVADAEAVFRKDVEPALLDIEEQTRSKGPLAKVVELSTRNPDLGTMSILGLGLGAMNMFSDVTYKAMVAVFGVGSAVYKTYLQQKADAREVESNSMFLYYRARKELQ